MSAYGNDPRVTQSGPAMWLIIPEPALLDEDDLAVEVRRRGDVFVVDQHDSHPVVEHATADAAISSVIGDPQ